MLANNADISETLEWMLQSRQVGEEILIETLIHEQYTNVYRFILSIAGPQERSSAQQLAEQTILAAVTDPSAYDMHFGVQVWLFKIATQVTRSCRVVPYIRKVSKFNGFDNVSGNQYQQIYDWLDGLTFEMRISLTLKHLFGLTTPQIAQVIGVQEGRAEALFIESSKFWLDREAQAGRLDLFLAVAPGGRWPIEELDEIEEQQLSRRMLGILKERDRRKGHLVMLSELCLAIFIIMFVAGMDRFVNSLSPTPTVEVIHQTRMVNQIVYISPTPGPVPTATPFPEKAILYQAEAGETLEQVANKISFDAHILSALNNIPLDLPLEADRIIMIGISESRVLTASDPTPGATPRPVQSPLEELNMSSSDQEIYERIMGAKKYWRTLWADALVIRYGPPGYLGNPEFRRQQVWVEQPYFNYALDGENGSKVEFIYSSIGGLENLLNISTGDLVTNLGSQELNYRPGLLEMIFSHDFSENAPGKAELLALDVIAGRKVLVLDWYADRISLRGGAGDLQQSPVYLGRYWVDTQLGTILRAQKFSGRPSNHLSEEIVVSKISFDIPIPRRLYDTSQPLQTYFSKDHKGSFVESPIETPGDLGISPLDQEVLEYLNPPAGFEINKSYLEIYWTNLSRFNPDQVTSVDIFGDGFYLGNVEFGEPDQLQCTRSPDGLWLAFSGWSDEMEGGFTPLGWFNLSQLPDRKVFNPGIIPGEFSFSPDNQQLAVYGCERDGGQACGIYLIDVHSGASRLLRLVEQGAAMVWSPDGLAIAIQGSFRKNGKWRQLIFDTNSGTEIYDGPFDWEGMSMANNSPVHDWGVQYPPRKGGLEICTLPPALD